MARVGGEPEEAQKKWDDLAEYRAETQGLQWTESSAPLLMVKVFKDWKRQRRVLLYVPFNGKAIYIFV